jgi:hypothetical protein
MKPAKTEWKLAFDFRMLSILLLIAIVPFLVGTWWLVSSYREFALEAQGETLAEEAEMAFNSLNSFLENHVIKIAGLTEVPTLREAIEKSNLDLKANASEAQKRIDEVEARWRNLNYKSPELLAILHNPASDFLRRYIKVNTIYRNIFITDMLGRTVAATGKTSDYQHLKRSWWKEVYTENLRGAVYIGDIHYQEDTKTYLFDMGQPFLDPQGDVMGVIMVGIDAREIHTIIASLRAGFDGTAALIRPNGSVIFAPGYSFLSNQPFPNMQDILKAREKGKRFVIAKTKPATILGLNSQGFNETYPHLNWMLVVSSPAAKVTEPLTDLLRNLIMLMLGVILMTFLIALWLSRTESRPILEEDAHFEKL